MRKRGFTLIELIVVMTIISILVLLGVPKYKQYTEDARVTKLIVETKELEKASQQYYMKNNDWPRLIDTPYTSSQIEAFGEKIYSSTGKVVELEVGNYYDIDYNKLSNYISTPDKPENYILQNPVGNVYAIEGIKVEAKNRVQEIEKPRAIITISPNDEIKDNTDVVLSDENSTAFGDREIVNTEWQNNKTRYEVGTQTVKLRVQDSVGIWSDWVEKSFEVLSSGPQPLQTEVPVGYIGIYTVQDLVNIQSNKNYILMNSLDLNVAPYNTGTGWTPRGFSNGTFDGNGLVIQNLYINRANANGINYQGLFGSISNATIKNLVLENPTVLCGTSTYKGSYVGSLVGKVGYSTIIEKCGVINPHVEGYSYIGGLIGSADCSAYTDKYIDVRENYVKNVNIKGHNEVGGLIGSAYGLGNNVRVVNNYVTGSLTWEYIAGESNDRLGGLAGSTNCGNVCKYNYAVVSLPYTSGHSYRGGIYGFGTAYDSYFNKDVASKVSGGVAKTTEQMKQQSSYITWDFINVWKIDEGNDYPRLRWER